MSKNINVCFSHNTDNWRTPKNIYDHFVNKMGCIDTFEYCSSYDQYEKDYYNVSLFCNPPYSDMTKVVRWLIKQVKNGCIVYLLVPCRTDTNWFHNLTDYIDVISFFKGRLRFGDSNKPAPFPSMLIELNPCTFFIPHINYNPYEYYGINN